MNDGSVYKKCTNENSTFMIQYDTVFLRVLNS